MNIHPLATAAITVAALASTASAKKIYTARDRNSFMKAMKKSHDARGARPTVSKNQTPSPETLAEEMSGDSKRARQLRKKVMEKAKPVPRKLQNNYKSNSGNYYANNKKDGTDDYYVAHGEWNQNAFGFDATQYSLSYHRCASVKQFDDEIAAQEDSTTVFATKHFAVFRFCPSKTCESIDEDPMEEWMKANQKNAGDQSAQQQRQYQSGQQPVYYNGQYMTKATFDTLKFGGANGEGCQSNYGEYMLELEDYLEMMVEYHNERFETYCNTCEECMYDVYQKWLQNGAQGNFQNRKLKAKSDPTWKDDLENADFQRARDLGGFNQFNICPEYDTCKYYQQVCKQGLDDSLTQYFECTEVQKNNGKIAYIGPHCSSDGMTITLGLYSDENCQDYIGDSANIANFIGFTPDADALSTFVTGSLSDFIPAEGIEAQQMRYNQNYDAELAEFYNPIDQMCIPCRKTSQPYEVRATVGSYYQEQENYDNEVNELCENLYLVSARCDKHYRSYNTKTKQAKYAEAIAQEDLSCGFIESVVMGNYNEMGFVNIEYPVEAKSGYLADSMMWQQHGYKVNEVTPFQIFTLIATIAICGILLAWATALNRALNKGGRPWRPPVSSRSPSIYRSDSGIVLGRSESNVSAVSRGNSYYMT